MEHEQVEEEEEEEEECLIRYENARENAARCSLAASKTNYHSRRPEKEGEIDWKIFFLLFAY